MKILITGGAGFIGFHFAQCLSANDRIVICDNLFRGQLDENMQSLLMQDNIEFINLDLTKKEDLDKLREDFDCVYHLAAINGTRYFYEIPHEVLRANILSLINLLDWSITSNCQRLIWTSSSEVYAGTAIASKIPIPTPEEVPLIIADPFNPRFSYAGSKIVGELLCLSYAKAYGIEISIVRPHNIYGPRMGYEHVIPQFIMRIIRKETPFRIYGVNQTRAFCFVEDFVKGLKLLGENRRVHERIFNIGNDKEEITIMELANKLFDLSGFHPKLEVLSPPKGSVDRRCPDITKARQELGYEPQVALDVGLRKTYEWYLRHYKG